MVNFVKEFESYILSENKEASLHTIVPGSESEMYLQILTKMKVISNEFPKEIEEMIEKFETKTSSKTTINYIKILALLTEYDIPEMKPERKLAIISKIKELLFSDLSFDYPKPSNIINNVFRSSEEVKHNTRLDQELFNPQKVMFQLIELGQIQYMRDYFNPSHTSSYLNFDFITEDNFSIMMNHNVLISYPLHEFGDSFLDRLTHYINSKSVEIKSNVNVQNYLNFMTLPQIEKIYSGITSDFIDKNMFLSEILNKKYMEFLNSSNNLLEKREILKKIYDFLGENESNLSILKSDILLQILENGISLNLYDLVLFQEYLKSPVYVNTSQYNQKKEQINRINNQTRWKVSNINYQNQTEESKIIKKYLSYFFKEEKKSIEEFIDFFQKNFLQNLFYESVILRGDEENIQSEEIIRVLGVDQYEKIINTTYLTICEHNKTNFQVNEIVSIEIDIKHIQTLFIKIFEINTENYYYNKKSTLNSNISLEGLIATYEEAYSFNEKPQKMFRRNFEFDKIPNKRGIYIIEFIGNGVSSRALIKKGGLSLISRQTKYGKMLFILDENSQICKSPVTGAWVKNSFYQADHQNGSILIPYMKSDSTEQVIIVSENFAELTQLQLTDENYSLSGSFYINHESVILGNTAKVLFRPYLFINNRITDLKMIKNPKISAVMTKMENDQEIPITNVFDKIVINNNREVEFELNIPPRLMKINLSFDCEVKNNSKDKLDKLTISKSFDMSTQNEDNDLIKMFLRKVDNEYILCVLGKNGEPKMNLLLTVSITHKVLRKIDEIFLQTNNEGEVYLGQLFNVNNINVKANYIDRNIVQNWIINDKSQFKYPKQIDVVEGDKIVLPYYHNTFEISHGSFLYLTNYNNLVKNCLESVKTIKLGDDDKHNLEISPPHSGNYILFLKSLDLAININVHKGKIWETRNYIILKDQIIENSENRHPIHFESLHLEEEGSDNFTLKLKVNKNSINPRVHLMAYQFLTNNNPNELFNSIVDNLNNQTITSTHPFQKWRNIYISNKQLHEEIQYVLDRKHLERYMGNSLEKPSLLLKRQFVRDTVTDIQNTKEGTDYDNIDPSSSEKAFMLCDRKNKKMGDFKKELDDSLSSFHNFLEFCPLIINNLIPDKEGNLTIPRLILSKYSHLQIIAVDESSVCDETISLKNNKIQKKNLSLNQPLDSTKFFSEIRTTELLLNGSQFNINDITSTSFKLIDSLENVVNYQTMINTSLESEWSKFNFLLKFGEMTEVERLKVFSKNICHEINIFLYFKYPLLFAHYVKPVIKYKFEKTFIDFFLLGDDQNIMKYCSPPKLSLLNTFEKCLLIYSIRKENPQLAQNISNSLQEDASRNKPSPQEYKRLFNIIMNMKAEAGEDSVNEDSEMFSLRSNFCLDEKRISANINMNSANINNNMFSRVQCSMNSNHYSYGLVQEVEEDECYNHMEKLKENCDESVDNYKMENEIKKMNIRNNLYKEAGKSKEYGETHYSQNWQFSPYNQLISTNIFWADLAKFWSTNTEVKLSENFLSKNIILTTNNITELICLLSVLDLPLSKSTHKFNRKEGTSLEIVTSSNVIVFTKEIKGTNSDLKSHLMIAQHLSLYTNKEKTVNELIVGEIYCHETIVTNISSSKLTFELLIQIPQGAIPVKNSEYTKSISLTLENFKTTGYLTYFYFPAEGDFTQFPPNASIDGVVISKGIPLVYKFIDLSVKKDVHHSLDDVLISGGKHDIMNFILSNENIKPEEWRKIYWLLKEKDFFHFVIDIMRRRGIYDQLVWNFGFYHKDEQTVRELLETNYTIKNYLGPKFKSSLINLDDTNNYDLFPHMDYHPLINARAHKLGKENNLGIMNKEFKETYEKFIIYLLRLKEIDTKDYLRLCYYLILQDRNEEAIKIFAKVNSSTFTDSSSLQVQYDYIAAYLDFTVGYPEFKIAKDHCRKYRNFPLTHWRELFEEIDDQLIEYEGLEIFSDVDSLMDEERKKKQLTKLIDVHEPKLSFKLEQQDLNIKYQNIKQITVKFYLIDLEILFSRTPFIQSNSDDFSVVQPNYVNNIPVENSNKEEVLVFKIPEEFTSRNLLIEINSLSQKCFNTYFSTSLNVTISEALGEIKITDNALKPLNKVYVKCFAKMNDETVKFYKDGYTDLRGKFNFVSLNTDQLQKLKRFAIFVMHDDLGSMIKECNPPQNVRKDTNKCSDYDAFLNSRQEIKQVWRTKNKK